MAGTMELAPLALVLLLGYGLLIAVSLTTWTAVTYFREEPDVQMQRRETLRTPPSQESRRPQREVSNDDVRGARSRRARSGNDPLEGEEKAGTVAPAATGSSGASTTGPVSWKRAPAKGPAKSDAAGKAGEEDAFERFLSSRPDDFDLH